MSTLQITDLEVLDLRFPTSKSLDGSDAMNPDPDYSAAYVILHTSDPALTGHGFTFTIGRGNELCVAAIEAMKPFVVDTSVDKITRGMGEFWRKLAGDSQLRWVGPEKGVIHLALAAILNAIWDLWAKQQGKPVWQLVADLSPEQLVSTIDFRHIRDVITESEAIEILRSACDGQDARRQSLMDKGYPAYTTSAGWLGYPDEKIRKRCKAAITDGWTAIKIKVGRDLEDDKRRCAIVRQTIGDELRMMIDANQVWEVDEAVDWLQHLAAMNPYWIEEPVSPDDILGHARIREKVSPMRVATGEQAHNRIMFKQMLQADAIDVVQLDNCRLGGLNEVLAVLLMAAKYDKPVCPHAGGVGLCEVGQHVSMIDYLCVSGTWEGRMLEHAGHLHEHFVSPIVIENGRYMPPEAPGFSTEIVAEAFDEFRYPDGKCWRR